MATRIGTNGGDVARGRALIAAFEFIAENDTEDADANYRFDLIRMTARTLSSPVRQTCTIETNTARV